MHQNGQRCGYCSILPEETNVPLIVIQPTDCAEPIGFFRLRQGAVKGFNQLAYRPAALSGEDNSVVCGVLFCQRMKVADVECKQYPPLRGCAEQLRAVVCVKGNPIVWGACHIVSAIAQRVVHRLDGRVRIEMQPRFSHPSSPPPTRIQYPNRFPLYGLCKTPALLSPALREY